MKRALEAILFVAALGMAVLVAVQWRARRAAGVKAGPDSHPGADAEPGSGGSFRNQGPRESGVTTFPTIRLDAPPRPRGSQGIVPPPAP